MHSFPSILSYLWIVLILPYANPFLSRYSISVIGRQKSSLKNAVSSSYNRFHSMKMSSKDRLNLPEKENLLIKASNIISLSKAAVDRLDSTKQQYIDEFQRLSDKPASIAAFKTFLNRFLSLPLDPLQLITYNQIAQVFVDKLISFTPEQSSSSETDLFDQLTDIFLATIEHFYNTFERERADSQKRESFAYYVASIAKQTFAYLFEKLEGDFVFDDGLRDSKVQEWVNPLYARLQRRFPVFQSEEVTEKLATISKGQYKQFLQRIPLRMQPSYSLTLPDSSLVSTNIVSTASVVATNNSTVYPAGELASLLDKLIRYTVSLEEIPSLERLVTQVFHDDLVKRLQFLFKPLQHLLRSTLNSQTPSDTLSKLLSMQENKEYVELLTSGLHVGHAGIACVLYIWQMQENIINRMSDLSSSGSNSIDQWLANQEEEEEANSPHKIYLSPAELLKQSLTKDPIASSKKKKVEHTLDHLHLITSLQAIKSPKEMLLYIPKKYHIQLLHDVDFYHNLYSQPITSYNISDEFRSFLLPQPMTNNTIISSDHMNALALLGYNLRIVVEDYYHAIALYNLAPEEYPASRDIIFEQIVMKVLLRYLLQPSLAVTNDTNSGNEVSIWDKELEENLLALLALQEMLAVKESIGCIMRGYKQALVLALTRYEPLIRTSNTAMIPTIYASRLNTIDQLLGRLFRILDREEFITIKAHVLQLYIHNKLMEYLQSFDEQTTGRSDPDKDTIVDASSLVFMKTQMIPFISNMFHMNITFGTRYLTHVLQSHCMNTLQQMLLSKDYHLLLQFSSSFRLEDAAAAAAEEEAIDKESNEPMLDPTFAHKLHLWSTQYQLTSSDIIQLTETLAWKMIHSMFELILQHYHQYASTFSSLSNSNSRRDDEDDGEEDNKPNQRKLLEQYWKQLYYLLHHPWLRYIHRLQQQRPQQQQIVPIITQTATVTTTTGKKKKGTTTATNNVIATESAKKKAPVSKQSPSKPITTATGWYLPTLTSLLQSFPETQKMTLMKCIDTLKKLRMMQKKTTEHDSWGTTEDNSFNDMLINQNEEEGIPPKAFDSMLLTLQKLLFASYTSGMGGKLR